MLTTPSLLQQAERFVGTLYIDGEYDCADLAADVQRQVFGRSIALPTHRNRPAGAMGQAREIHALRSQLADPVSGPFTGCGVMLTEPVQSALLWHIGTVFLDDAGTIWVLHNSHKQGSACLHRLADLQRWGLRLEGYYAWRPAK